MIPLHVYDPVRSCDAVRMFGALLTAVEEFVQSHAHEGTLAHCSLQCHCVDKFVVVKWGILQYFLHETRSSHMNCHGHRCAYCFCGVDCVSGASFTCQPRLVLAWATVEKIANPRVIQSNLSNQGSLDPGKEQPV